MSGIRKLLDKTFQSGGMGKHYFSLSRDQNGPNIIFLASNDKKIINDNEIFLTIFRRRNGQGFPYHSF